MVEKGDFILIVGGGKAGHNAFNFGKRKEARIIIIDNDRNCTLRNFVEYYIEDVSEFKGLSEINDLLGPTESILIHGDIGTACLLIQEFEFKYIFPTVPQHLAAKLAVHYLTKVGRKKKPDGEMINKILLTIPPELVLSKSEDDAIILLSYMPDGMYCADNCTSPDVCPITRTKRNPPLFELIKSVLPKNNGMVIESIQIEPGLGGFEGKALNELFKFIKRKKKFIIATASRCHGIINALSTI